MDAARIQAGQVKVAVQQQVIQPLSAQAGYGQPAGAPGCFVVDAGPSPGPLPPIEVRVCSWNLHGNQIHPSDDVTQLLTPDKRPPDVLVVGVQELVELGARTVMLNGSGDEQRQAALEARVMQALSGTIILDSRGPGFTKVCSFGMVGLAMLIYVRDWLKPYVRELHFDRVKTGLDGMGGNKGGICARLVLGNLSMCFVNVHLASGQNATAERNQHLLQILSDSFQSTSCKGGTRSSKNGFERSSKYHISQHQFSLIFGDFNIRLDLPKDAGWPSGLQDKWLEHDQMLLGHMSSVRGFREGIISFPPTYKYKIGSQALNTKRCPAWCDRVIYKADKGLEVNLLEYDSLSALNLTSDHHPVLAHFILAGVAAPSPSDRKSVV